MNEEFKVSNKSGKSDKKANIHSNIRNNKTYIIRIKLLNESGWSNYNKQLYIIKTPKFVLNSKILLKSKDKIKFTQMINQETKSKLKKWKLIYRASKNGRTENIFKATCHDKKNLVCLIHSNIDNIFGGFTSKGWMGTHSGRQEFDDKAFLYLFKSRRHKQNKSKIFRVQKADGALYNQSNYYCFFNGNACALYINQGGMTGYASANCSNNYEPYPSSYYLSGETSTTFHVKEIEVFQLKKQ